MQANVRQRGPTPVAGTCKALGITGAERCLNCRRNQRCERVPRGTSRPELLALNSAVPAEHGTGRRATRSRQSPPSQQIALACEWRRAVRARRTELSSSSSESIATPGPPKAPLLDVLASAAGRDSPPAKLEALAVKQDAGDAVSTAAPSPWSMGDPPAAPRTASQSHTRRCAGCGKDSSRTSFSVSQWNKPKAASRCRHCVEVRNPPRRAHIVHSNIIIVMAY